MATRTSNRSLATRVHDGLDTRSRASDKVIATTALLTAWVGLVLLATALLH